MTQNSKLKPKNSKPLFPSLLRIEHVQGGASCRGPGFDAKFGEQVISVLFNGVNG
jgi:hypothetical protein